MKKQFYLLLTFILIIIFNDSSAQFNFYKYSVGVGGGVTLPFADTREANYSLANQFTGEYYFTPYLTTGLELQVGNMRGGEREATHFTNSFALAFVNTKIHLGQFYKRYDRLNSFSSLLKGIYVGGGFGIIKNNVDQVIYLGEEDPKSANVKVKDIIFPINLGYSYNIPDFYGIDRWEFYANFQYVFSMEDVMDGNLSPYSNFNDIYYFISGGLKYKFGSVGLDKRKGLRRK